MALEFKRHAIDTNQFIGIVGTETKQRVAMSQLLHAHDLSDIMNKLRSNTVTFDDFGMELPRFTFQSKGISLHDFLSQNV